MRTGRLDEFQRETEGRKEGVEGRGREERGGEHRGQGKARQGRTGQDRAGHGERRARGLPSERQEAAATNQADGMERTKRVVELVEESRAEPRVGCGGDVAGRVLFT